MIRHVPLALLALTLAACGASDPQAPAPAESLKPLPSEQPSPPVPAPEASASQAQDECGAGKLGGYVGQPSSDAVKAKVGAEIGHGRIRWIGPNDAVTMDFRADRLNADLAADGKIKGFRCG